LLCQRCICCRRSDFRQPGPAAISLGNSVLSVTIPGAGPNCLSRSARPFRDSNSERRDVPELQLGERQASASVTHTYGALRAQEGKFAIPPVRVLRWTAKEAASNRCRLEVVKGIHPPPQRLQTKRQGQTPTTQGGQTPQERARRVCDGESSISRAPMWRTGELDLPFVNNRAALSRQPQYQAGPTPSPGSGQKICRPKRET